MTNSLSVNHLNKLLANFNVLYAKLHHYHWYVKGDQFFVLHEKFQELYEQLPNIIDDIAERILAIGGRPASTLKQYIELSSIAEASGREKAEEMVEQLERDYSMLADELKNGVQLAEKAGDIVTADLLTGIAVTCEKTAWLLRSYLPANVPSQIQHV